MHLRIARYQVRYGVMLIVRGCMTLGIAVLSIVHPETYFIQAILAVASLLIAFGAFEVSMAFQMRRLLWRKWRLPLLDGTGALLLGVGSFLLTITTLRVTTWFIAIWFCFYAICLYAAAVLTRRLGSVRTVLFILATLHVLIGLAIPTMLTHPRISMLVLPSLGIAYVVLFGLGQIFAGRWIAQNGRNATGPDLFLASDIAR